MMENVVKINFADITEGLTAFITIALMPLTYSIGDGLTLGILSYVVIYMINNIITKDSNNRKRISPVMYILAFLFIVKLVVTGGH